MRLTRQKRKDLAQGIRALRNLQDQLFDAIYCNDHDAVDRLSSKIDVANSFLIGELEVLINEPDELL